ncbi:Membrane protein involved in the export of O-antigen and teichoic acid [Malonomonas rubra DSM 5091]|uniref:Membrane protein involved in the export of O-antigen and teichoic acid n=1 Tax=Malonomonas rubra DSM 5091 TaxID=1122189 RepID=A0A1M6KDR6_MALRU|nr:oligosaccharide flippase family protein [Malonomonas rubra]SHJ57100.1 Membrane protein involved in the export of O-antigen and teichoic acid [Malonomonas rubra DSM 5091]
MSARTHLRNLAFNWGGHAATLLVMFFLSPYIVGKLDAISYGIWSLLNVLTGYMGIFDLGVRASVGRYVALYLGKNDLVGVDETIRAGFGFFSLAGVLILLVGIGLGWLFPAMFEGVPPEHYDTVSILLPLMVVNVWLAAIAAIYSSVLAAHDRFDLARGVDLVVLLVRTVGTIYALEVGWGLWGLVLAIIAGNICAVFGNRIFAGIIQQDLRTFPFLFSQERIKELLGYGLASFFTNAAVKIIGQSDLVIVGIFLAVADVREYNVGAMLVYYSATFIVIIGNTFFPAIQRAAAGGTEGEVRHLFYRQLRVTLCFGLLVYVGFVFYSKSFIDLWMFQDGFGKESVFAAAEIMALLALSKFPTLIIQPCVNVLSALGYVAYTAKVTVVEAFVNLLLSILFVTVLDMGIAGVAGGTLVARLLVPSVAMPWYLFKKLRLSFSGFVKSAVLPSIVSSGLFSTFCWLGVTYFPPEKWSTFSLQVLLAVLIWFVLGLFLLVPVDLRIRFFAKFSFRG